MTKRIGDIAAEIVAANIKSQSEKPPAEIETPSPDALAERQEIERADVTATIGERVYDAGYQVGTGIIETAQGIGYNVVEAMTDKAEGAVEMARGLAKIGTAEGWEQVKDGAKQFGTGVVKDGQTVVDAVLLGGGRVVSAVQVLTGLEEPGRALHQSELDVVQNVFGDSVNYAKIRVKEGYAGVVTMTSGDRAMTHGNTIYMKTNPPDPNAAVYVQDPNRSYENDLARWRTTLVHETTHVWQNQNGGSDYMSEAIVAQQLARYKSGCGDDSAAYNFELAITEGKSWAEMNPEQQAKLIDAAYQHGYFDTGVWRETVYDDGGNAAIDSQTGQPQLRERSDLTAYMDEVTPQLRAGQGAP